MTKQIHDESKRYLIIGGATRSGSTSLFHYLSDHPEICPSTKKEPRFFMDPDYPIHTEFHLGDGLNRYQEYFKDCGDAIRLEASPQYLFSSGTAKRIRESLSDVRLIFLIRDPIEWLISSFRFAKQIGRLPSDIRISDWLQKQLILAEQGTLADEHHFRALVNGRFAQHINRYREVFRSDEILVVPFEFLSEYPNVLLDEICDWVGINQDFFQAYDFRAHNRSGRIRHRGIHSLYRRIRRRASRQIEAIPMAWRTLRGIFRVLQPIYFRLNTAAAKKIELSVQMEQKLQKYFKSEYELRHRIIAEMNEQIRSRKDLLDGKQ